MGFQTKIVPPSKVAESKSFGQGKTSTARTQPSAPKNPAANGRSPMNQTKVVKKDW